MEDRRVEDMRAHEKIMQKLDEHSSTLVLIGERQNVTNERLKTINGTVADYNSNKQKFDKTCVKVEEHDAVHEGLPKKYISKESMSIMVKTIGFVGTILVLIISASTVLQILKVI